MNVHDIYVWEYFLHFWCTNICGRLPHSIIWRYYWIMIFVWYCRETVMAIATHPLNFGCLKSKDALSIDKSLFS